MTEQQYEKEVECLETDLREGYINKEEFRQYLKELNAAMQEGHGYDDHF